MDGKINSDDFGVEVAKEFWKLSKNVDKLYKSLVNDNKSEEDDDDDYDYDDDDDDDDDDEYDEYENENENFLMDG
jgi:hypothetical protein